MTSVACKPCDTDADCVGLGDRTARSIKGCAFWQETEGMDSACVVPAPPPS